MKPILQALLLADYIYEDKRTGKKVVAGIFNRISIGTYKMQGGQQDLEGEEGEPPREGKVVLPVAAVQKSGNPTAYISLTEIRGEVSLEVQCVNLDTHELVYHTSPLVVKARSPLDTKEIILPVPALPNVPGAYVIQVLWDGEILGMYRVILEAKSIG